MSLLYEQILPQGHAPIDCCIISISPCIQSSCMMVVRLCMTRDDTQDGPLLVALYE